VDSYAGLPGFASSFMTMRMPISGVYEPRTGHAAQRYGRDHLRSDHRLPRARASRNACLSSDYKIIYSS